MEQGIQKKLVQIVTKLGASNTHVRLDTPGDITHGDYSTNIALVVAKELKRNPRELAAELVEALGGIEGVEKIEIAGPGFINFWLTQKFLIRQLETVPAGDQLATAGQSAPLEYFENTQPNTNKPLHIGHLRNTALSEAIVHLRQAIGHDARSVNINNDRGIHIIKAMYGYLLAGQNAGEAEFMSWEPLIISWVKDQSIWKTPRDEGRKPDHFVGEYYVKGDQFEHSERGDEFKEQENLMLIAWEDGDPRVRALWEMMNTWFYAGFRETHARFVGIDPTDKQFDKEWYESEIYAAGKQLVLDNMDKKFLVKSEDGAIVANLEDMKLPDKVVIRKNGTSMYVTQDLELIRLRIQEDKADLVANVVADEQDLYFKQLYAICEKLGITTREHLLHISYGIVNLKGGVRMSSRKGTAVQADELMDTIKQNIKDTFKIEDDTLAEQVMLGAIKYWMLRYSPKAPINFDIEESVDLGGNSGPYLQYTYARTRSVLAKGEASTDFSQVQLTDEETNILRKLVHYQEIISEAAEMYSPHMLCTYLYELAQLYNEFYQKQPILKADEPLKSFRLALTKAVGETIKHGLSLLGIPAPEKM